MALTAPFDVPYKDGIKQKYYVATGVTIYAGALVAINSEGKLVNATKGLAGVEFVGVALDGNTAFYGSTVFGVHGYGFENALQCFCKGCFEYPLTGVTVADIGKAVYVIDENTLTLIPNGKPAGFVKNVYNENKAWVEILPAELLKYNILTIPFVKKTTAFDTGAIIPAGSLVLDIGYIPTTAVDESTLTIGTSETATEPEGGDADGFIVAGSCATDVKDTFCQATKNSTTAENVNVGALLEAVLIKDANTEANYVSITKPYFVAANRQVSYTTSNHNIAGTIYIIYAKLV
jgi:hypothetical protein